MYVFGEYQIIYNINSLIKNIQFFYKNNNIIYYILYIIYYILYSIMSMNFTNNSNHNNNNNNNNLTNNKSSTNTTNTYPKLIEEVNCFWNDSINKIEKIKEDIQILEKMFNNYGSNTIFIQAKTVLTQELDNHILRINKLEEQFYVLKRNFNIN
jgi:hypothetical protein